MELKVSGVSFSYLLEKETTKLVEFCPQELGSAVSRSLRPTLVRAHRWGTRGKESILAATNKMKESAARIGISFPPCSRSLFLCGVHRHRKEEIAIGQDSYENRPMEPSTDLFLLETVLGWALEEIHFEPVMMSLSGSKVSSSRPV